MLSNVLTGFRNVQKLAYSGKFEYNVCIQQKCVATKKNTNEKIKSSILHWVSTKIKLVFKNKLAI